MENKESKNLAINIINDYSSEIKSTKVLLICISNKNGNLLTHNIFYKLFSEYGKVNKVSIIQKFY